MGSGETATAGIKDEKQILHENASLIPRSLSPYLRELLAMPDFKYLRNLFSLLLRVSFKSGSISTTPNLKQRLLFSLYCYYGFRLKVSESFDKG
jgi:hypothetical protein